MIFIIFRCLKVWYDLPSDVFHTATANIDTFLAKMKVGRQVCPHFGHEIAVFPINNLKKKPVKGIYLMCFVTGASQTSLLRVLLPPSLHSAHSTKL